MKNILACFILCNMIVLGTNAQISKTYYEYSGNQSALDIVNCSDGGYLILSPGLILRVNEYGGLMWEKHINYFGFMAQETDGGYYIAGNIDSSYFSIGYLVKINKQGDLLWSKKYKYSEMNAFRYIKRLSNSDIILSLRYYLLGSMPNYNTIRTDSLGNIIWSRGTWHVETSDIVELENNDIVVIGSDYRENQPPQFPETKWPSKIKYSSNGAQISWVSQEHMDWTECTASVSDGVHYYTATSNVNYSIFKMGDSLIQWTKYFGNLKYYSICTDTTNLYFTGSLGDPNWADLFVLSITSSGDSISIYLDSEDYNHHGKKIIIDKDSLVILGHAKKFNNSDFDLCLTKIPIQYILTSIGEKIDDDHSKIEIFPNPATSTIYFDDFYPNRQKRINVYNISGKLEFSEKHVNNCIDVSELDSGLYLIEILCGQEKKISKFVKN